ncbi:hypothetical protein B0H14DRAFT_2456091 [Mycena olivaceomarginata]|nr:hypothetical protein B0H14DRAFT_2456091 [Mycena olivaceomarginata]
MATNLETELPFELHAEIFLSCLPLDGRVRPSPTEAPLALAQVCRHWRAIALAIPQLWSSIFFEFPRGSQYEGLSFLFGYETAPVVDPTTALVKLWFSRCEGYPLSITLRCCEAGARVPGGLIEIFKNTVNRWRRLELVVPTSDLAELGDVSGPFPSLQSLAIDITDDDWPLNLPIPRTLYTQSPHLTSLRIPIPWINSGLYPFTTDAESMPLRTLEVAVHDLVLAVVVLDLFPHLHNLILHKFYPSVGGSSGPSPVPTTGYLTCLVLDHFDFLNHITLPALVHLGICIWGVEGSRAIVSFVQRSKCTLTRLTLRDAYIGGDMWSALLPVAETVPSLELFSTAFLDGNQRILLPQWHVLPHLQRLFIITHAFGDIYGIFLQALEGRSALLRVRLKVVPDARPQRRLDPIPVPGNDVLARLRDLTAEDMRLTVETPTYRWPEGSSTEIDGSYNIFNPEESLAFFDW